MKESCRSTSACSLVFHSPTLVSMMLPHARQHVLNRYHNKRCTPCGGFPLLCALPKMRFEIYPQRSRAHQFCRTLLHECPESHLALARVFLLRFETYFDTCKCYQLPGTRASQYSIQSKSLFVRHSDRCCISWNINHMVVNDEQQQSEESFASQDFTTNNSAHCTPTSRINSIKRH